MKLKFRNLFIAFVFAVLLIGTTAHATSYPIVLPKGFDIIENAGNTVSIGYSYWGQYQNERLELHIYDNSGKEVHSDSKSFSSYYDTGLQNVTFFWDTKGLTAGKYTAELHKFFYSYFSWREAPTTEKTYITLKEKPKEYKKGTTFISGKLEYKITSVSESKGTVQVLTLTNPVYTSLNIPAAITKKGITFKVTSIAKEACDFSDLNKVVIGENVKYIGKKAFYYCDDLKTIIFNTKQLDGSKVGSSAFGKTYSKARVSIPASVYDSYVSFLKTKGFASTVRYEKR